MTGDLDFHDEDKHKFASRSIPRLPPRQRTVLALLLRGLSRKQIATELELSNHTVNDHVKDIYHAFEVHSYPELIRKFMEG